MTRNEFCERIWLARYSLMKHRAVEPGDAVVHISREDWMRMRMEAPNHHHHGGFDSLNARVFGLPFESDDRLHPGEIRLCWEVEA